MKNTRLNFTLNIILFSLLANNIITAALTNVVTLKDVFEAANAIRANPKGYANVIQTEILNKQDSNGVITSWGLAFNEKRVAVQEAINYLANTAVSVPALILDQGLTRSSWEHSKYQIDVAKDMTHTGPSGRSGLQDRFKLYNTTPSGKGNSWAENIANAQQGWFSTATLLCLQWIIDDGVSSRGHRANFFNAVNLYVGIGIYPFIESGRKQDRVTMFYAQNSSCTGCSTFTKEVKDNMCWNNYAAGLSSCDPAAIVDPNINPKPDPNVSTDPKTGEPTKSTAGSSSIKGSMIIDHLYVCLIFNLVIMLCL